MRGQLRHNAVVHVALVVRYTARAVASTRAVESCDGALFQCHFHVVLPAVLELGQALDYTWRHAVQAFWSISLWVFLKTTDVLNYEMMLCI